MDFICALGRRFNKKAANAEMNTSGVYGLVPFRNCALESEALVQ